jgi:hypothetical protein
VNQPEPIDPPPELDTETPVDKDVVNAARWRSSTFLTSDIAAMVDRVLIAAEDYHVDNRAFFVREVIAGLQEEMEK